MRNRSPDPWLALWLGLFRGLVVASVAGPLAVFGLPATAVRADATYDFSYAGRLTSDSGKPVDGPVALKIAFYRSGVGGSPLLTVTSGLSAVLLQDGLFQVNLTLAASDYQLVFSDVSQPVYVETTDLTNSPKQPYDRQQIGLIPYAAKVPVDNTTVGFNAQGQLSVLAAPASAPGGVTSIATGTGLSGGPITSSGTITLSNTAVTPGRYTSPTLSVDAQGRITAAISGGAVDLASGVAGVLPVGMGGTGVSAVPANGQLLIGNGAGYTPRTLTAGSGISITNTAGTIQVASTVSLAGVVAKTGDTMTGSLILPTDGLVAGTNELVLSGGNVGIGTASPQAKLTVNTASSATGWQHTDGTVVLGSFIGASNAQIGTESDHDLYFFRHGHNTSISLKLTSTDVEVGYGFLIDAAGSNTGTSNNFLKFGSTNSGEGIGSTRQLGANLYGLDFYTGYSDRMVISSGGNVGIGTVSPTHTLEVVGSAANTTGGAWLMLSDQRLKTIEGDYQYGLAEVKKLHTVRFKYQPGNALNLPSDAEHTGVIAQEVAQLIPDAVLLRPDGYLELNADPIHWAVVNSVKELSARNDALDASVARLTSENQQLKAFLCSQFPTAPMCQP